VGFRRTEDERHVGKGFQIEPLGANRRMVAAAAAVNRENDVIHLVTEADVTEARRLIAQHRERTGERPSLTGYVVACLARTLAEFPGLNSFRRGGSLVLLDDVTISVLVERDFGGERVPEPVVIHRADRKTYREIGEEIRGAQAERVERLGTSSGVPWVRFIPGFLLKAFVRLAARSISMQKRFGVVGVTAVGMFGAGPTWLVPLTNATVTVAVGTLVERPILVGGSPASREHLCLTISFDHDIVDGAPASRFAARFAEILASGDEVRSLAADIRGTAPPAGTESG
jgi:pyruvate/2-oxoglutarate dehydrogenase complex dihydrolipoamide acyltransferase (E2) component